jgi:hypothetical protein
MHARTYRTPRPRLTAKDVEERVVAAAKGRGTRRRLSCRRAHELARQLGVGVGRIGAVCERKGIKIVACQLGCF